MGAEFRSLGQYDPPGQIVGTSTPVTTVTAGEVARFCDIFGIQVS